MNDWSLAMRAAFGAWGPFVCYSSETEWVFGGRFLCCSIRLLQSCVALLNAVQRCLFKRDDSASTFFTAHQQTTRLDGVRYTREETAKRESPFKVILNVVLLLVSMMTTTKTCSRLERYPERNVKEARNLKSYWRLSQRPFKPGVLLANDWLVFIVDFSFRFPLRVVVIREQIRPTLKTKLARNVTTSRINFPFQVALKQEITNESFSKGVLQVLIFSVGWWKRAIKIV